MYKTYPYSERKHNVLSPSTVGVKTTSVIHCFKLLLKFGFKTTVSVAAVTICSLKLKNKHLFNNVILRSNYITDGITFSYPI